jgi:hypothetical protein
MLHNPKRLNRIETWSRWLAWLDLIAATGYLILLTVKFFTNTFYLTYTSMPSEWLRFWEKAPIVTASIETIFGMLGSFLFLMGTSKAVRFLRTYYAQITPGELEQQVEI